MATNTNLKYADSSLNYLAIIMVKKFLKIVCARHVVKRPAKHMRVGIYIHRLIAL